MAAHGASSLVTRAGREKSLGASRVVVGRSGADRWVVVAIRVVVSTRIRVVVSIVVAGAMRVVVSRRNSCCRQMKNLRDG